MMYYLIWTPIAFLWYVLYSYMILKNHALGGHWFWIAWCVGAAPIWLCTSKFSKDLIFDGMLYDVLMFVGYSLGALYFTHKLSSFTVSQWAGMLLVVMGLFLVKSK